MGWATLEEWGTQGTVQDFEEGVMFDMPGEGIFILYAGSGTWEQLIDPMSKVAPPVAYGDRHGMTYDLKRNRLLLFHFGLEDKYKVFAYDFGTKGLSALEPEGSGNFPDSASLGREAIYLPTEDLVLVCTRAEPEQLTLIYDPAANAWLRMEMDFERNRRGVPMPKYGVSLGVMYDPGRNLIWASDVRGRVFVMRFDRRSAALRPLGAALD